MRLPKKIVSLESVEEKFRVLYAEKNGAFILDVDESDSLNTALRALESERTSRKGLADQLKTFEDVDLQEYEKLKEQQKTLKDKPLSDSALQKALDGKMQELSDKFSGQIEKLKTENLASKNKLNRERIGNAAQSAASKLNVFPSALEDVVYRVSSVFSVNEEDKIVGRKDGIPLADSDGKSLSVEGYIQELTKEAPHLFKPNEGSGLTQSATGYIGNTKVIKAGENRNLTLISNLEDVAKGKAVIE